MISTSTRRALLALATAAALVPATPALAQTATPTPSASATPTPTATLTATPTATPDQFLNGFSVSKPVIDFGDTVDVTVRGSVGTQVDLFLTTPRTSEPRRIRTGTINASGSFTWTGLRPQDNSAFFARAASIQVTTAAVAVRVRRTVTIGISQANGVYTFSGQVQRVEAGVQVTIARLDSVTKRVTGVASARTNGAGRYTVRTALPQGLAGYYALTDSPTGLDAGRSRLYGLLANARPAPIASARQSITISVDRVSAPDREGVASYRFSGRVTNGANVPVTLARNVNGGPLVGVLGGRTSSTGAYSFTLRLDPALYGFQVLTASARSQAYGLVVPGPASDPLRGQDEGSEFFANCAEARAAGAAPVLRGDPGYSRDLDRDGDGVGCE